MSGTWLTADLHLGHRRVAELRGFATVEDHDKRIVHQWRRLVHSDDRVWVLGDVSAGGASSQERALSVLTELPGRKCLVAGNHDSVHPMHGLKANLRWLPAYQSAFDWIGTQATVNVESVKLRLSHFPFQTDHTSEPRHLDWRMPDTGQWLAHGHTHSSVGFNGRELHVGLDAHELKLVPLGVLADHIRGSKETWR